MGTNDEVKRSDDSISRQEAIKAVSDLYAIYGSEGEWVDRRDVFNALRKLPSAQPDWIPVSDRLPEESGRYLISALDGIGRRTTVAPYQSRYKAWTMTGRMAYWKVVAWMPLPEAYKGGLE